jgi:hypothetical protein
VEGAELFDAGIDGGYELSPVAAEQVTDSAVIEPAGDGGVNHRVTVEKERRGAVMAD